MATTTYTTVAEAKAAFRANGVYAVDNDADKCRAFVAACIFLIDATRLEGRAGSAAVRDDVGKYERALARAESWLETRGGTTSTGGSGGRVIYGDLREFRG